MKTVVKFLAVATVAFVSGVVFGQFQKGKTIGNSIIDGVEDAQSSAGVKNGGRKLMKKKIISKFLL